MLMKLIQSLISSKLYNKIFANKVDLPDDIDDPEKIVRVLFYPSMVTKDKQRLRPIAFRPQAEQSGVSVMRQSYCTPTFCKRHGKKFQSPGNKRAYFGFGLLTAEKIRSFDADIVYTPDIENNNPYHADIEIGYILTKGEQLPAEYQLKVDGMVKAAKLYIDPSPHSNKWEEVDLIY
ncbi:MAG: hypothetical protein ACUZ8I_08120 [Candidatus Scalindua sp.]